MKSQLERFMLKVCTRRCRNIPHAVCGSITFTLILISCLFSTATFSQTTYPLIVGKCSQKALVELDKLKKDMKGKPYILARKYVIASGWMPVELKDTSRWRAPPQEPYFPNGEEAPFVSRGFSELDSCAIDQGAPCVFLFRNTSGYKLRVDTYGEEAPPYHAKVDAIQITCGEKNSAAK